MQVAIVSTDGQSVDEHFGKANRFLIYEISPGKQSLLTVKETKTLSTGDREHSFDPELFSSIAGMLEGCKRVYSTKIGVRPAEELRKLGIEPVIYEGVIENIIL